MKVTGCTVHFVVPEVDAGPIILQRAVEVKEDDTVETLSARILKQEHAIYPLAVKLFVEGKLSIKGRRVSIRRLTATLMDGKALAAQVKQTLKEEAEYMKKVGVEPKIATILVGDDPPSKVYLASKHKAAEEVGIMSENYTLPGYASEDELVTLIEGSTPTRR